MTLSDFCKNQIIGSVEENINLSVPPATGEEYIKRVIVEAQKCDDVVIAQIDRRRLKDTGVYVKALAGCVTAPHSLAPAAEWQKCQITDFSDIRLYVARLKSEIQTCKRKWRPSSICMPEVDDKSGWIKFCLGSNTFHEECKSNDPTLEILFSMNQPTIEQVLEYLIEFVEIQKRLEDDLGRWIYALLVVLEVPLNPDMCSCLRSLARICSVLRADLSPIKKSQTTVLNLFICLVARYFRQLDLADP
ncbi:gem-associated protein 2 isoform X2 [Cephus cinctus]|uniref:Gem-associated protein 2 n=1 Tax=Cephus cinctus TaxID=211228 RepID=A0AAJ7FTT0_CEPCN|nr:gem-associated protein 2 isoform X2 [Cephus cinctus]